MPPTPTDRLRDCMILAILNLFGIVYFGLFAIQLCIFHFPSRPDGLLDMVSLLTFCGGVIFWCLTSLTYRIIKAFDQTESPDWQKLEFCGAMTLINATSIPYVLVQYTAFPSAQLSSVCALSLVAVAYLVDFLGVDSDASVARARFPYHCVSLGLLSLAPAIYALAEPGYTDSPLTTQFFRSALWIAMSALNYAVRPLERLNLIVGWRPSLYAMHLAILYNALVYSRVMMQNSLLRSG
ncbi:Hly-III-related protein [Penicillium chermesinum]|uniref:Hly-III-related protein n=1 Tax=Penicillium chermesinum TaxID=63820 RepID=A0A9W9TBN1_9EURO|nr:Hly-III-related protein [Penicillium chermesinum]KAJ5216827.1 Hly-III-related protein [Penicillium chermesinum]KAJ6171555.1 Hly-III-related protein [Penicillium chermesinum]